MNYSESIKKKAILCVFLAFILCNYVSVCVPGRAVLISVALVGRSGLGLAIRVNLDELMRTDRATAALRVDFRERHCIS